MPDRTLLLLASEIRAKTLKLLQDVTEDQARFTGPAGLSNSILWHAGHAYTVVEHLGVAPATGELPKMPAGWFETFSWMSKPATVTHWPTIADVTGPLREQLQRLTAVIERLTPEQLDKIVDPAKGRTLGYSILHALHDEAMHQGEMFLLKKILAKQGGC